MAIEDYDDFLTRICAEYGLKQGYRFYKEWTYHSHVIFEGEEREYRMYHLIGMGKRPKRNIVANISEEPGYNTMEGCIGHRTFGVKVVDSRYTPQIEAIASKVKKYSEQREKESVVLPRMHNVAIIQWI